MKRNKKSHINNEIWNTCPMGFFHDGLIECYYFGIVKIKDCNKCNYRK